MVKSHEPREGLDLRNRLVGWAIPPQNVSSHDPLRHLFLKLHVRYTLCTSERTGTLTVLI